MTDEEEEETRLAPAPLDILPDAVLSDVFKALAVRASWPLRAVCRRWRRVVEEMEWACFDLDVRAAAGAASAYDALSALFEERKLRLGGGASIALRAQLVQPAADLALAAAAAREQTGRTLEAACRLLGRAAAGPGRPRGVTLELVAGDIGALDALRPGGDFVRACLLGALAALLPAEGAPSALEGLAVGVHAGLQPHRGGPEGLPWPAAAELRAALAPFGALRSLTLFFGGLDAGAGPEAAAAVAAACPLLRSLGLGAAAGDVPAPAPASAASPSSPATASTGPAASRRAPRGGGGLRGALRARPGCPRPPAQPHRPGAPAGAGAGAGAPRASAAGPDPAQLDANGLEAEALGPLAGLAGLRELAVCFSGTLPPERAAGLLRALAAALSRLPRLARLSLELLCLFAGAEDVAGLLGSAGARRALTALDLSVARPLSEEEAAALLALPALERLHVNPDLRPLDPACLRPTRSPPARPRRPRRPA
eukprot:tig00000882_g5264.t1